VSPIQTAKGIYKLITADPDAWSGVKDYISGRYGNQDAIYNTFVTDPVGALTDLSAVLSGGGSLMKLAGKAGKIASLSDIGNTVKTVGRVMDPVSQVFSKGVPALGKKVGSLASDFTGTVTGVGPQAIKKAFESSPDFMDAMRGKYTKPELIDEAMNSLKKVSGENKADFANNLQKLKAVPGTIDQVEVLKNLDDLMDNYNVKWTYQGKRLTPVPDFSESPISRKSQIGIKNIINDVTGWQDWTPAGVHNLKRKVGDMYLPTKNGNAFAASMYDDIVGAISKEVPDYTEWMAKYGTTENKLNEIEKTLSLGENSMTDTAGRKLTGSFRDVNDYRLDQLKELDNMAGTNLQDKVAGTIMNPTAPSSQLSKYGGVGMGITGILTGHPVVGLGLTAAASPRIVGEVSSLLGRGSRAISPLVDKFMPRANTAYELNALTNPEQAQIGSDKMYQELINKLTQAYQQNLPGGTE
jgi:hypothetical protein